jgi:hypothetical protein
MTIPVTIKVSAEMASAFHRRNPPAGAPYDLSRIVEALGVALEPLHPNTIDPDLSSYFLVNAPDLETAQRVIDRLQRSGKIEAAYIKPPDAPPS